MKKPKMIMFDAGNTLIKYVTNDNDEDFLTTTSAIDAIMNYASSNPNNLSNEEINDYANDIYKKFEHARCEAYEINNRVILKTIFDSLAIKFSISFAEIERIIWSKAMDINIVSGVIELIDFLKENSIRTAIITNLDFSAHLLKERLDILLPNNDFEFVLSSSDYGIRKPNKLLFDIAISKSNLDSSDIWYVGDNFKQDICGSENANLTPIYLNKKENCDLKDIVTVKNYNELIDLIKKL